MAVRKPTSIITPSTNNRTSDQIIAIYCLHLLSGMKKNEDIKKAANAALKTDR